MFAVVVCCCLLLLFVCCYLLLCENSLKIALFLVFLFTFSFTKTAYYLFACVIVATILGATVQYLLTAKNFDHRRGSPATRPRWALCLYACVCVLCVCVRCVFVVLCVCACVCEWVCSPFSSFHLHYFIYPFLPSSSTRTNTAGSSSERQPLLRAGPVNSSRRSFCRSR